MPHIHLVALNEHHTLGPVRTMSESALAMHLITEHLVSVRNAGTKSELGRLHLLAHATMAYPELLNIGRKGDNANS